jgi:hypothetical protein
MVAPLLALGKAYAVNKAKNYATSKIEDALGLPKDTIGAVTNPVGFAKNIVKDVAKDYAKNEFLGRDEIPEEDRSFRSTGDNKLQELETTENMEYEGDYKRGGKVKSKANKTSRRGDGIAQRGKTKGRYL